jgi:6-phosphogluconate dehydrogenase
MQRIGLNWAKTQCCQGTNISVGTKIRLKNGPLNVTPCFIFLSQIRQALYASKIISYAQGFMLLREAAKVFNWNLVSAQARDKFYRTLLR